jgi:thiol-disulfide isomerase/thioredoxin
MATVCLASCRSSAQTLSIGDSAPPITVSKWVKGEKVDKLQKDQTYVVEFWATWCVPCKVSIPHLTELQKKYKDVKFIGVSVIESKPAKVEPFVKEMGEKMVYTVATDDVPKGAEPVEGKMVKNWMLASGSEGIPTAFLVKSGKVIWIGEPMELDGPLEKINQPNFDLARFIAENREEMTRKLAEEKAERLAMEKKLEPIKRRLKKLGEDATPGQVVQALTEAFDESPELEKMYGLQKYVVMIESADKEAATYAMKLVEGSLKNEAEQLNTIAWSNLEDDEDFKIPDAQKDTKLALKAALRANELTEGKESAILDTLALAYFKTGDATKALETQEKAMKFLAEGESSDDMKERLEKYKKAVAEKKKP